MSVSERDREIAAQLWCLPQHSKKVMDCEFAESIAEALAQARQEERRRCAKITDTQRLNWMFENVYCIYAIGTRETHIDSRKQIDAEIGRKDADMFVNCKRRERGRE